MNSIEIHKLKSKGVELVCFLNSIDDIREIRGNLKTAIDRRSHAEMVTHVWQFIENFPAKYRPDVREELLVLYDKYIKLSEEYIDNLSIIDISIELEQVDK